MNALLNGKTINQELTEVLLNRGFRFGDGCFETFLIKDGHAPLLSLHEARLRKSMAVLKLTQPAALSIAEQLAILNKGATGWQRVRLWVWRTGGGLYQPENSEANFLLATSPCPPPSVQIRNTVFFSEEVRLMPSRWSFIKSISAQPYVMAGLEKKVRAADELILLNHKGEVAEATAANLFWKKRGRWYTPALESGCVAGVMRSWLMQKLLEKGKPVFEVLAGADELTNADKLVCTNVTGLQPITALEEKQYDTTIDELWEIMPDNYSS